MPSTNFTCPRCGSTARVLETRRSADDEQVRRGYVCNNGHRFSTTERCLHPKIVGVPSDCTLVLVPNKALNEVQRLVAQKMGWTHIETGT